MQFLLNKGANPNAVFNAGIQPLHSAAIAKQRDIVALLIDSGADPASCTFGYSVLHFAVNYSNLEVVKCLVEKGANVNDENVDGLSPLSVACRRQRIKMIEYLVNAVNIKNGSNETPLKFIMIHCPNFKLIKAFIERYGYLTNFIDIYYRDEKNISLKGDIFQNIQVCTQAIINKFNNKDLPAFYNLPLPVGTLPPIQNLMIASQEIIQDIEQSVRREINTNEHCDLRRPKVIVLRMLSLTSYINYYNRHRGNSQLKRSATADSEEPSQSRSKIQCNIP